MKFQLKDFAIIVRPCTRVLVRDVETEEVLEKYEDGNSFIDGVEDSVYADYEVFETDIGESGYLIFGVAN